MDRETAQKLNRATSAFYAANAESFSSTRERPWDGWAHVLECVAPLIKRATAAGNPFRVLDIGCGNMRFESMLADMLPTQRFEFYAADNCIPLACEFAQEAAVHFQQLDIIECLKDGTLAGKLDAPLCDLVVAFGFMHHIPLPEWREELLRTLIQHTKPGGIIALTFWQFANNEKMAAKAAEATARGSEELGIELDRSAGDYLMGWQGTLDHFRYCHSFTNAEIDQLEQLALGSGLEAEASFSADGPDGKSNRYLILKKVP